MSPSAWDQAGAAAGPAALVIRRRRDGVLGGLVLSLAAVWCVAAVRGLLHGSPAIIPGLGPDGAVAALMVGIGLGVLGLSRLVRSEAIAIAADRVELSRRRLLGVRIWHEPLDHYRGVRARQERRPHRYGPRVWHIVELWHPRTDRTVELERTRDAERAEHRAQEWSRALGLPLTRRPQAADIEGVAAALAAKEAARPLSAA